MQPGAARQLFATARVARLATADANANPHIVPVVFALEGDTIYTAVDHKRKRTQQLRRLANVGANPHVSVLADHYDEDWADLWWARGDGTALVLAPGEARHTHAAMLLTARYEQYRAQPPHGPALAITIERWSGWRA